MWTSLWHATLPRMGEDIELRNRFRRALREAMEARTMSQRELGRRLRADPRRVAAMLAGRVLPTLYEARDLAAALNVDESLFRDPPPVPPDPPKPYYPIEKYLLDATGRHQRPGELLTPTELAEDESEGQAMLDGRGAPSRPRQRPRRAARA